MEKKMNFGMNAAEVYEAPVCEVLELQTEGVLCSSGGWGTGDEGGIHNPDQDAQQAFYYDEEE